MQCTNTEALGFVARPLGNSLAHWELTLLGDSFDPDSVLGMQLIEWGLNHGASELRDNDEDEPHLKNSNVVRPADVQVRGDFSLSFSIPIHLCVVLFSHRLSF